MTDDERPATGESPAGQPAPLTDGDPNFQPFLIGLSECRVCAALVPAHDRAQQAHSRWHATEEVQP